MHTILPQQASPPQASGHFYRCETFHTRNEADCNCKRAS